MEAADHAKGADCFVGSGSQSASQTSMRVRRRVKRRRMGTRKTEKEERRGQRTRELLLDRTEISAVHILDQLCLMDREHFVANGEQRRLSCVSEFHGTMFDKQSTMTKEPYALLQSHLPMTSRHTVPGRILNTQLVSTKTPHLPLHDERLDVGQAALRPIGEWKGSRTTDWGVQWPKGPIVFSCVVWLRLSVRGGEGGWRGL